MSNLSDFILTLYPATGSQPESVKLASQLESLSIEELADLAGVPMLTEREKRAYGVALKASSLGDDGGWLSQFEGSPLYEAAIQLCEQELEMRSKHLQERLARQKAFDHESEWAERDQMDLQKQRLELALHKHKAGKGGMPSETDQGSPAMGAPQTAKVAGSAGSGGKERSTSKKIVDAVVEGGRSLRRGWSPGMRSQVKSELRDPRLYSNIRGAVSLESRKKRVEAHKGIGKQKSTIRAAMREGFGRKKSSADFQRLLEKISAMGRGLALLERRAVQAAAQPRGALGSAVKKTVSKPPPIPAQALKAKSRALTPGSQMARARSNAQFAQVGM